MNSKSTDNTASNAIALSLFASRIEAVCDEMGAVLQRTAFSPNIKDRLDFSCAVFGAEGELCAQAAHIPVHLGSMAYAMRDIVRDVGWAPGDMVILNDPYLGGTHLPDVTLITPVYMEDILVGFVANRAHHADIGATTPGSMPISRHLEEEGMVIPPTHVQRNHTLDKARMDALVNATSNPTQSRGDFAAQISANRTGLERLIALVQPMGVARYREKLVALNDYAARLAASTLNDIPDGEYCFRDVMDDDGLGHTDLAIEACVHIKAHRVHVDFTGTADQTEGNINCPLSVAAAGVYYVFRCLMPDHIPACSGAFRSISLSAPEGSLLNARRPAAVAAGNVETSTRVVDVVIGALAQAIPERIPAASHGSMNNLAMGARSDSSSQNCLGKKRGSWDYYETLGGGMGAGPQGPGLSAIQTHMTNTLNTPIEVLETNYPVRVRRYAIRKNSGGSGKHQGGDGLLREFEFLAPTTVTLLTERRSHSPWGLQGGGHALPGANWRNDAPLPAKISLDVEAGERITVETPGGGGWGSVSD